ncbi:MAG: hypothetical protein KBD51_03490 [Candidatus Levybacteria bacterium]|nr:hypothetical protein [Candidatus Levybacteria bacterium]
MPLETQRMYSESKPIERRKRDLVFGLSLGVFSSSVVRAFEMGALGVTPPAEIRGHMHDALGSFALSYVAKYIYRVPPFATASLVFFAASASEVAQGFGFLSGRFDPKDMVAYGLGTSTYYAVEKFNGRKKVDMKPNVDYSVNPNIDQTLR